MFPNLPYSIGVIRSEVGEVGERIDKYLTGKTGYEVVRRLQARAGSARLVYRSMLDGSSRLVETGAAFGGRPPRHLYEIPPEGVRRQR